MGGLECSVTATGFGSGPVDELHSMVAWLWLCGYSDRVTFRLYCSEFSCLLRVKARAALLLVNQSGLSLNQGFERTEPTSNCNVSMHGEHATIPLTPQVGVVSDFDLLALDVSGKTNSNLFPNTDETWQVMLTVRTY